MKKVLILHGTGNNSQGNWFPWLKMELEKKDYQVWVPDLPRADKPNLSRYNQFIFSNKHWTFNEDTVIIGHSSGAVAILGLLQHLPENTQVGRCILVSAFKDNVIHWDSLNELFLDPFNYDLIKQKSKKFIVVHSDNDPYIPLDQAEFIAAKLDAELLIKEGQGHFSGDDFKQLPFILELIGD
jgi:uncharacterized protein